MIVFKKVVWGDIVKFATFGPDHNMVCSHDFFFHFVSPMIDWLGPPHLKEHLK